MASMQKLISEKKPRAGISGRRAAEPTPDNFAGRLGSKLRERRNRAGLSIHELSGRTGGFVNPTCISMYERGKSAITVEAYLSLCKALGVSKVGIIGMLTA